MISTTGPASADQISDAKAQAAAVSSKLQAIDAQRQALTGQVTAADYQLSQLRSQIAASQTEIAKDKAAVNKDKSQLRSQAITDYMSSGSNSQVTQMFSSNMNANGIRSEYSSIATGNVTTTIAKLHTAQSQLQATTDALQQKETQASATRNSLAAAENQASALAGQYQGTLNSVNANIAKLVVQQQNAQAAAAKAAAAAAFNKKVAAAQAAQAAQATTAASVSSTSGGSQSGSSSSGGGSTVSVPSAPAPPLAAGAAGAVQAAESQVGVPYVWGGASPSGFDCSGLVEWSYAQVGISLPHYSGGQYDATTHIALADIAPGDLLFYGPGGSEHVAMYVGGGSMIEAPFTGSVVHITGVRTDGGFVGVGRVG